MTRLVLALIPLAFLIAAPITLALVRLGRRFQTFDSAGVPGQLKAQPRRVPNTGGIGVFWSIVLPISALVTLLAGHAASFDPTEPSLIPADLHEHMARLGQQSHLAWLLLACLLVLHALGLLDDRRPLGPFLKLGVMAIPAAAIPLLSPDTRLLTFLDAHAGGAWLSITLTALWLLVVTNAMNFMDNMDGLSAGVSLIAGACFLTTTLLHAQWFVGACLALLIGACAGFLVYNFPWRAGGNGASIFLGDGGSLVLGFLLAFLTIRTTYAPGTPLAPGQTSGSVLAASWYHLLMPLIVLAVPLYDFVSVCAIRLAAGKSPFVGDLNHLSHRLTRRGLSKRSAVLVIYGFTAISGLSGILLPEQGEWQALLLASQVVLMLGVVGVFEYAASRHPA